MGIKILTYNVRGLRDKHKRRQIFKYLHERDADIILLQNFKHVQG